MKQLANADISRLKNASPFILTCVSAVGMTAAVIFAVKATPKAMKLKEEAEAQKGEPLTIIETVKTSGRCYIPTAVIGALTLLCLFGANAVGSGQRAAYISAYGMLEKAFSEYRAKVDGVFGDGSDETVQNAIVDKKYREQDISVYHNERFTGEVLTFYEPHRDEFFETTMEQIVTAAYHLNRNFALRGYAPLNEFYEFLGIPKTDAGDILGWSMEAGFAFYGYQWIDFDFRKRKLDDGMVYYILAMPFEPTSDYLGEFD